MFLRTAKSCGPDAPTLASSLAEVQPPNRVGMRRISVRRRWQQARSPGSAKETVKTIACGNAGRFRCTRCYSCAFYQYECTRGRGCNGHPAFPTPSLGERFINGSGASRREVGNAFVKLEQRHCERSEAIHLAAQRKNGLLRCARNDGF